MSSERVAGGLERISKAVVVAYSGLFEVLRGHSHVRTEENHKKVNGQCSKRDPSEARSVTDTPTTSVNHRLDM